MQAKYSFRTRMLVYFWLVLLAALILPPWYYFKILNSEIIEETKSKTIQQLRLVEWMIQQRSDIKSAKDIQVLLVQLGQLLDIRLTYVAEGGTVISDSDVPFPEIQNLENHSTRPEIMQTLTQDIGVAIRYSGTTQQELMYTAKRVQGSGPIPRGVLRVAAPISKVKEPLDRLKIGFLAFVPLAFAVAALISYLLIRRLNRPIREMIEAAEAISSRDFNRRIYTIPGHEFYPLTQAVNTMAESIQDQIKKISDQKQELEAVFDAMHEAVMVLDSRGKIKSVNRTFAELTQDCPNPIGRRPIELIPDINFQRLCDRAVTPNGGENSDKPQNLQIALGGERNYDVNVVSLSHDKKEGCGAVAVFHDITELKRLEKVRRDFVANVSHELRTPLTSIKGYTETLLSEAKPDPQTAQSFLQVILKNTNHLAKMVQDLLQLSRLEAPDAPLRLAPVNAADALLTAWRACTHHAVEKSIRLETTLPSNGILALADYDQLVQVFRNLLENAIRYSPVGDTIQVSCDFPQGEVSFSVRDNGPGISRKHQQRIFERFYRVEKHRSDPYGSTGLGLAICRHIIKNHNGKIWLMSPNPDDVKGTTFFFTLKTPRPVPGSVEASSAGNDFPDR